MKKILNNKTYIKKKEEESAAKVEEGVVNCIWGEEKVRNVPPGIRKWATQRNITGFLIII